jgi:NAD(P)H-hydrate epimerase
MCHGVSRKRELDALLETASAVAAGPGLGKSEWARMLLAPVMTRSLPTMLDADALNLLAEHPYQGSARILTPHPGEAARLLGTSTAAIQRDRIAAARAIRQRYGGTVVLKGAGTIVAGANDIPWICDRGNPGMAAPGMGDVLTGVAAAMLSQGLNMETAALSAVFIHASAGDRAARAGERGMLASDLIGELRGQVNQG